MAVDLRNEIIGFVSGFEEGKGRTGYQIKMLVRGMEHTFDCTEEPSSPQGKDILSQAGIRTSQILQRVLQLQPYI